MNISKYIAFAAFAATHLAFAAPTITGVTAQQRYPWNGMVDITYTVSGDIAATAKQDGLIPSSLKVSAKDGTTGISYEATSLSGDTSLANGTHTIVWDMREQGLPFLSTMSTNVIFTVFCDMTPATYCVIDLSAGADASSYPISYLAEPPNGGFNADAYKTTKLVLKRIEAGSFKMGGSVDVKLTKPFFIGLFEVTQKQFSLVRGSNPSYFAGGSADKRPVGNLTYSGVRGNTSTANWPSSNAVGSSTFMGLLRARTGLDFDLPTEAQWEYACRAGTTTTYSSGDSAYGNYMWYHSNSSSRTHDVGIKQPNPWGLYDMHGNVREWCLDWYASRLTGGTDPKGPSSGSNRVNRGGCWNDDASFCTSSYRSDYYSSYVDDNYGFRLARALMATSQETTYTGSSSPTTVGTPNTPIISPESGVVSWPLSVTISCSTEGVTIHYTTDGTDPTVESPIYRRFRIAEHTTVKAVAIKNGAISAVSVAEYASGQCANPIIIPTDGTPFYWSGQEVSIAWEANEADNSVLRYTTDGSDPTAESPVYNGPFTIDDSTIVKAKAFGDQFFDSSIVTANLTRVWMNVATPTIAATSSFTGSKTEVAISCATEGAKILYTLDGSELNSHSTRYTGPFYVTDSCTVKAYATCYDYLDSAVTTQSIEKVWGIGDTVGASDHTFATGGDLPFVRVTDSTAPLGESMKSGAITHSQTSTLSTTVMGPGTISFQWKTSCEDSGGEYDWDHVEFWVDDTRIAQLDGETAWQTVTQAISDDGSHTLLWKYVKDDMSSEGEDCCWVADYHWVSALTETQTTPAHVPYVWLRTYYPETPEEYDFYEAAAKETAANGVNKVWECYVAGLVPTNVTDVFRTVISMEGGKPQISWEPRLNAAEEAKRVYTIYGRERLEAGGWTTPTNAASRFFKVKVNMVGEEEGETE